MFMFRSRRTNLTKRLVKVARKRRGDEARRAVEDEGEGLQALLKKLKENQLEMLCTAVESRGQERSNCVLLPRENDPHVLCCQTWRWPDVRQTSELRRIPACRSASDPVYICCNPYHWSRLCRLESPPPPYSRFAMDRLKPEDKAPSEVPLVCRDSYPGSLTTNGEDSQMNSTAWCKLAYWEFQQRIGPQFPVEMSSVNIFGEVMPYGDGLCLETLALTQHSFSPPAVQKTMCKIGLGITLSREDDGVWVYNRSESPIFVNSLTLEDGDKKKFYVTRVPAECCLCVFDPIKAAHQNYERNVYSYEGPVDTRTITLSFAKGWGPGYSRQNVMFCPCWLEIILTPCR